MAPTTRRRLPALGLILAILLWASSFVVLKQAIRHDHPMQVIFGRMLIASLCFAPFVPAFLKLNWRRRDLKCLLIMAICEFLAMVCAAGYTVSLKHLSSNDPPLFLTAFQAFVGSLFFPFLLLTGTGFPTAWETVPALEVIYPGTFTTFGADGCYIYGVILGLLILGERLNLSQWLACTLVTCGGWLSSLSGRRRQPPPGSRTAAAAR